MENIDAWDAYDRVSDQIYTYPTGEEKVHIVLRVEAVKAVIDLMSPADPLETFDRVLLIHRAKYRDGTG